MVSGDPLAARATDEAGNERREECLNIDPESFMKGGSVP